MEKLILMILYFLLLLPNRSNEKWFHENVRSCGLTIEGCVIKNELLIFDLNGNAHELYSIMVAKRPKLVFTYSSNNCGSCISTVLLELQEHFKNNYKNKIVIITDVHDLKYLKNSLSKYKFNFSVYTTRGNKIIFNEKQIVSPSFFKFDGKGLRLLCKLTSANENYILTKCKYAIDNM